MAVKSVVLVGFLITLFASISARADTATSILPFNLVQVHDFATGPAGDSPDDGANYFLTSTLGIPKFDPSLGELTGVELRWQGTVDVVRIDDSNSNFIWMVGGAAEDDRIRLDDDIAEEGDTGSQDSGIFYPTSIATFVGTVQKLFSIMTHIGILNDQRIPNSTRECEINFYGTLTVKYYYTPK